MLIAALEPVFNIVFMVECVCKIIAFGFINGRHAYIKDSWNKLDFFVVLISILGMIPGLPNLSVLRTFRVLRPLRSLARAEGLKKIIGAVLDSIPDLYWVIVLLCFVLLVFSIAGLVFWNGILHARCRITPFPIKMPHESCYSVEMDCWSEYVGEAFTWYQENYYDATATYDPDVDPYRCLTDGEDQTWLPNDDSDLDEKWNVDTSPWKKYGPLDCIWPRIEISWPRAVVTLIP